MKHVLIVMIIISFNFIGCSKDKNTSDENNPSSKPQKLYQKIADTYYYKFGELDTIIHGTVITKYDSLGNETELILKGRSQEIKLHRKTVYQYYPSGKIKEQVLYESDGSPITKSSYTYDANNLLIQESKITHTTNGTEDYSTTQYKYQSGKLVEEYESNAKTKIIRQYDANNRLIGRKTFYKNELGWVETYKLDDKNNIVYSKSQMVGSSYNNVRLFKYDSLNRQIEEKSLDRYGKQVFRSVSKYNKDVEIESINYDTMDIPESMNKYTYVYK